MNHPLFSNEWIREKLGFRSGNNLVDKQEDEQDEEERQKDEIECGCSKRHCACDDAWNNRD